MKAVWGRFWGNPVNARQGLSGLQKCNILALSIPGKIITPQQKRLTVVRRTGISAAMKTPTTNICICAIIIG